MIHMSWTFQCFLRRSWLADWMVGSAGAHIVDTQGHISIYHTNQLFCIASDQCLKSIPQPYLQHQGVTPPMIMPSANAVDRTHEHHQAVNHSSSIH
jgi:hypothetical protein